MRILSHTFQRGFWREYAWAFSSSATLWNHYRYTKDSLDISVFLLDFIKRKV